MERKKNESLSFSAKQKESVSQALQKLMRGRTIREVSQAWGVASSNINNYLYRGSIPRADILKKIAVAEGISIQDIFNLCKADTETVSSEPIENLDDESDQEISIKDRILLLIGNRSRRSAAKDWGMSISTLTNFLDHGVQPTYEFISRIAQRENISAEWLLTGMRTTETSSSYNEDSDDRELLISMVMEPLHALTTNELDDLHWLITRKGVEFMLELLDENNQAFFSLSDKEKKARLQSISVKDVTQQDQIAALIDAMPIRSTLKQAFKVALAGDEDTDREILRRIQDKQHTPAEDNEVTIKVSNS